jgi:formyltetrahydrofolate synthetase
MKTSDLQTDIAVIKECLKNIDLNIIEIKKNNRDAEERINILETGYASLRQRLDNFALFQTALSLLVGAIAAFLGAQR